MYISEKATILYANTFCYLNLVIVSSETGCDFIVVLITMLRWNVHVLLMLRIVFTPFRKQWNILSGISESH